MSLSHRVLEPSDDVGQTSITSVKFHSAFPQVADRLYERKPACGRT